jgi:rhodanese-related sulfurtransferase
LGGFCPGTSLVALATLKIDGIFFVLGGLFGVFAFSEVVDKFTYFYNGSYFGRVTLMDIFNLPTGVIVIMVTFMALFMLWGGEKLEQKFGGKGVDSEPKARYIGAGIFVLLAAGIAILGQPTTADRWQIMATEKQPLLEQRAYQIAPPELLHTMHEHKLNLVMIDVRDEADYNIFHLLDAKHIPLDGIPDHIHDFIALPPNTVFVVMSNDETAATEAWKTMTAESVPNVYILEGGINNWLDFYGTPYEEDFCAGEKENVADDELRYDFTIALGAGCPAAFPEPEKFEFEFEPKIKLELKRAPSGGGCG